MAAHSTRIYSRQYHCLVLVGSDTNNDVNMYVHRLHMFSYLHEDGRVSARCAQKRRAFYV